jgi:DNA-binding Lrp family transcriptional regulator
MARPLDELDVAILREMARDKVMYWGGLDPRLSAQEIARRLGSDPSTVRGRVRAWHASGFLTGSAIWPNVRLLGGQVAAGGLRIDDPKAKPRVLQFLGDLDGVLTFQEYVGPWVGVSHAFESQPTLDRRLRVLAALPGVAEVQVPFLPAQPQPATAPSPLDWRILAELHARPDATLQESAERVGISAKTFARRYDALVAAKAVWYVPSFDFTKWVGAVLAKFVLTLRTPDARAVRAELPELVSLLDLYSGVYPDGTGWVEGYLHLPSAAEVEDATRRILAMEGVAEAEVLYPRRFQTQGSWVTERLAAAVRG